MSQLHHKVYNNVVKMPNFNNPFTKAKREEAARQQQEREAVALQLKALHQQALNVATAIAQGRGDHVHIRPARPQQTINVLQVLTSGQELLQSLRAIKLPELSLEAFPLINSAQRHVQQLRDAVSQMPAAEQEVWQFQIQELDDEIRNQTERIMAGAAALPPPPGGRSSHHRVQASAGLSTASRPTQVKPSNNGRTSNSSAAPARGSKRVYTPPSLPEPVLGASASRHGSAGPMHAAANGPTRNGAFGQPANNQHTAQPALQRGPSWSSARSSGVQAAAQAAVLRTANGLVEARSGHNMPASHVLAAGASMHGVAQLLAPNMSRGAEVGGQHTAGTGSSTPAQHNSVPVTPNASTGHMSSSQTPSSLFAVHSTPKKQTASPFAGSEPQADSNKAIHSQASGPSSHADATSNSMSASGPFLSEHVAITPGGQRTAALVSKGLSLSLARRMSSTSGSGALLTSSSAWSAGMTAAAAAAYAAQAGVGVDDLASKKTIKKKTRGVKVGYGLEEDDTPGEVSNVIPGQPMPGPEYLLQQQLPAQAAGAHEQQDAQLQALIQQRQAYLQTLQSSTSPAAQQSTGTGGLQSMDGGASHVPADNPSVPAAGTMAAAQQQYALQTAGQANSVPVQAVQVQVQQQQQQTSTTNAPPTSGATGNMSVPQADVDAPAPFKVKTTQPLQELAAYLEQLQGPINVIQQAAVQAAAVVVAALATAVRQGHARQAEANERCRMVLSKLSELRMSTSKLETQQASTVAAEDFEAAAQLDAPLQQAAAQQDALQASLNQLREASAQAAELQTTLVAMQADACTTVATYLARLQANHKQLLQGIGSAAQQDTQAVEAARTSAAVAIAEARAALAERKAQVAAALDKVRAQLSSDTASLQQERSALAAQQSKLQEEIGQVRLQLSALEGRLAEVSAALQQVTAQLQTASIQAQPVHAQLTEQQAQLDAAERELEARAQQADQQREAAEQQLRARTGQHEALSAHGTSLGEAVAKLNGMAARIMTRVAADRDAAAARQQLQASAQEAEEALQQHLRRIHDCEQQLAQYSDSASGGHTQLSQLQQAIAAVKAALAPLEASKAAAASQRDFREAGRLQAELRARSQQLEALQAQLAAAVIEAQQQSSGTQQLQGQLAALRADVAKLRRADAYARWKYLLGSAQLRTQQVSRAAGLPDVVSVLKLEADMELEEAAQLAATWAFEDDAVVSSAASTNVATVQAGVHTNTHTTQQQQQREDSNSLSQPTRAAVVSEQALEQEHKSTSDESGSANIVPDATAIATSHYSQQPPNAAARMQYTGHISSIMMMHNGGPGSHSSTMPDTPHSVLSSTATDISSTGNVQQQVVEPPPEVQAQSSVGLVKQQWQSNELFDGLDVVDIEQP